MQHHLARGPSSTSKIVTPVVSEVLTHYRQRAVDHGKSLNKGGLRILSNVIHCTTSAWKIDMLIIIIVLTVNVNRPRRSKFLGMRKEDTEFTGTE